MTHLIILITSLCALTIYIQILRRKENVMLCYTPPHSLSTRQWMLFSGMSYIWNLEQLELMVLTSLP